MSQLSIEDMNQSLSFSHSEAFDPFWFAALQPNCSRPLYVLIENRCIKWRFYAPVAVYGFASTGEEKKSIKLRNRSSASVKV